MREINRNIKRIIEIQIHIHYIVIQKNLSITQEARTIF